MKQDITGQRAGRWIRFSLPHWRGSEDVGVSMSVCPLWSELMLLLDDISVLLKECRLIDLLTWLTPHACQPVFTGGKMKGKTSRPSQASEESVVTTASGDNPLWALIKHATGTALRKNPVWFEMAELKRCKNPNHHKLLLSPRSLSRSFLIFRFIWTSAPGFLWRPEPGRSPVLRARLFTVSTQPAATALRPSPYWSSMRSSWRGQPSEPSGCKDPPDLFGCLIKCL